MDQQLIEKVMKQVSSELGISVKNQNNDSQNISKKY